MTTDRLGLQLNYSLEGYLLVAAPNWNSELFRKSVCLVVHHSSEGAVGVFLNRSLNLDSHV